eukprot:925607-Prorocentrum_lima.AAC.1
MLFKGGRLRGILGLSVDDLIGGGDSEFHACCSLLRARFPFGKWRVRSGRYCGKDLCQGADYSIEVSQK